MKSGKPKRPNLTLTPRDGKILRHVAMFGLTTFAILHRVFFQGKEVDAVKSTLRRLCGTGPGGRYLKAEKLDGQRVYYHLARKGAQALGLPLPRARAYGRQARYRRLAILWFIHGEPASQRQLVEFRQLDEELGIKVDKAPRQVLCLDAGAGKPRLSLVLVDHGAATEKIVHKGADLLGWILKKGWFDDLIRDRAFALTILTLSESKRQALAFLLPVAVRSAHSSLLNKLQASVGPGQHIELNVVVVDGLAGLLPGKDEHLS